jgi:predicted dehydrogenase
MNIGILGTGGIAVKMTKTIQQIPSFTLYAIASRTLEKAEAFKNAYGFRKAYGSYEELASDKDVDLVYIASPHSEHYRNILLCLKHKRPILCEKAFTANASQAREVIKEAEKEKVFLTEAIWTRYMPSRQTLDEIIASGIIGEPYLVSANLCYPIKGKPRLTDPNLAGGALLDVGVYPLNFALMVFKEKPASISASCTYTSTGVDETDTISLTFSKNRKAILYASMDGPSDRSGFVYGDKGYIQVININNTERIDIYNVNHELVNSIPVPFGISGYEWELYSAEDAIKNHKLSCLEMSHQETIEVMEICDEIRRQMKVIYPFEKTQEKKQS